MKALIGAALAALFISGCTTNETRQAEANYASAIANQRTAEAQAAAEEAKTIGKLADKVDAGGASAYLIAKALKGIGLGQAQPVQVVQQPQSIFGLAWQSVLQVADIALRGYGIKANRDLGMTQSNNNRDVSIASYGAFTTLGHDITAGYQYVQAPGATTTTSNTLSGTGVLGSGTYTAPVTTTTTNRDCRGGSGAAGGNGAGTTTGAPGGVGGAATGGTC